MTRARPSYALRFSSVLLVGLLGLTGCGGDGGSGSSDTTTKTTTGSSGNATLDITFKGDTVSPAGTQVKVEAGKPLTLHIVADKPGEIHVHSSPEQELEYAAGTSEKTITLDQPGVVEMESHTLDKLIAQLEVR
jgi:hypothetical protein